MVYVIPGIPIPLLRARHSTINKRVYNSQHTQQLVSRINLQEQHRDLPLFQGPIHIDITFYMPITQSNKNKKHKTQPRQLAYSQT